MKIRLFLILQILSVSGCSLIYSYSDNLPQRIDQWVEEKKYRTALNTINHIQPNHKKYRLIQRKKKLILAKIIAYEKKAIEKSKQLANRGDWLVAISLLDKAEDNIVNTKNIRKHRARLLQRRNLIIAKFENNILNSQAENLLNKMALYEKIKKTVSPDESNELNISMFDNMRQKTSLKLANRSEVQYKKGLYDDALTSIELALKLKPNKNIVSDLNNIKKSINKKTKHKKITYVKEIKLLLSKLSQGHSHEILKETKEKIIWLDKIKANEKVYRKLIASLKKHLKAGVKQHFEAARKLYSEGKTQEALSIWLDLKELDPKHPKLQSHINRAEKIISKLKKLSNKPENKK